MRMTRRYATLALAAGLAGLPALAAAQAREVTTAGFDAQRSNWVRTDVRINRDSIGDGSFKFLWKHKYPGEPRQLESLTQPVLLDFLVGYVGFKSLAFFGGADDVLYSIDTDLAKPYWTTHLTSMAAVGSTPGSTWTCPGGLFAAPSRVTPRVPTTFGGFGGGGGRATSAVGEPGKGAAVLSQVRPQRPQGPPSGDVPPPPAGPARTAPSVPFGGVDPLWTMGSDGYLRTVRVTDGGQVDPPVPFLPPNARPSSLISVDGLVYTSTSNNCGNAPNGVWALDLLSKEKKVTMWDTGGANVAGSPAIGTSGIVYAATGAQPPESRPWLAAEKTGPRYANSVVALDRVTLDVKDWFTANGAPNFSASPMVFRHKGKDFVTVTGNDGRVYLLDGTSLGGADHKTPLFATPPTAMSGAGAAAGMATWQDADGTRWLLAPLAGKIAAFKVVDKGGAVALEAAWQSRELGVPLAPIVVNGIVFAAASGQYYGPDAGLSAAERAKRSTPAVLYALDPATGKELWSSGSTITSFARAGLAAGGGQVYLVTYDNTLYAFGIPLEH